jgi:hypothetical protein
MAEAFSFEIESLTSGFGFRGFVGNYFNVNFVPKLFMQQSAISSLVHSAEGFCISAILDQSDVLNILRKG